MAVHGSAWQCMAMHAVHGSAVKVFVFACSKKKEKNCVWEK
jgi:hypothetical protein